MITSTNMITLVKWLPSFHLIKYHGRVEHSLTALIFFGVWMNIRKQCSAYNAEGFMNI